VLIDYQNVHLTARDTFAPPRTDARDTLVSPAAFADRIAHVRASTAPSVEPAEIASVRVFRGVPSNANQPRLYSAAQAQRSQWTRDGRVQVHYRTLRYGNWPAEPPREKGVDVHLAVELVRIALLAIDVDVVIVASHDTDLEPALEMAAQAGRVAVETAGWAGCRRLRVPDVAIRHTSLDSADFMAVRDRRDYWGRRG
jgi:uncharacterized LabA/DUF88 family protein